MSQRTGRSVSPSVASVKSKGKKVKQANMMHPGVPEAMSIGDQDPSDASNGNDGSKAAMSAPKGAHKGPDRTKG